MNESQIDRSFRLFPEAATRGAHEVDAVYAFTLGISIFFSLLLAALVIGFCIRYRKGGPHADPEHAPLTNNALELGWTAFLGVVFVAMFAWSAVVYARITSIPDGAEEIHVVAKQWMWKFQYPSGRKTIDLLVVPANRPVKLLMTSQDVIHSLFVPAFRLKQDVLPFRYSTLSFVATRKGDYHLFCAEYCGRSHARMHGVARVLDARDYVAWVTQAKDLTPAPLSGEQLFASLGCPTCHESPQHIAPSLRGLFGSTVKLADGSTLVADEDYVRSSIVHPTQQVVLGFAPVMPSFEGRLTEEQLLQLVAYVRSLGGAEKP